MTLSDELLRGPRGRRLCLAVLTNADDAVMSAVFWLGHELDPSPGTIIRIGGEDAEVVEDPTVTEAEVAELIRRVDLTVPISDEAVRDAMGESVDRARYWQEPDGEDLVAALPEVREALRPVAERLVAAMPELTAPFTTTQWAVDWRPESDSAPIERDPAGVLARWAGDQREEEQRAVHDRPEDPSANFSGAWWSVPGELLTTRAQVRDALEYVEDSLGWEVATVIPVRGTGRILEVGSAEDWAELCRQHPMDVTASRRHDWFRVTGRTGRWIIPDWESVAQRWDAVHLTTLGYLSAATRLIEVDDDRATVIAGWAPDSTVWLTDAAREWEGPRQQWQFVDSGDRMTWTATDGS
ncbi:hypothetical protein HWD99_13010 [Microbacterium sp. C5A9]|uniref:hypothetical protein n=1 Tax=Microbacterium sp. C5A9 TaxID=2736663 RepID=UPI001F52A1D0|nr:hypothetical protein [Microbacterium sp. C5A9]MCI1019549.1 hypothetical protein [Microbacterium sp. C5A9]